MSENSPWKIGGTTTGKKKAPYASKQKLRDGMSESEKSGVRIWNTWHDTLTENGLMEDKK